MKAALLNKYYVECGDVKISVMGHNFVPSVVRGVAEVLSNFENNNEIIRLKPLIAVSTMGYCTELFDEDNWSLLTEEEQEDRLLDKLAILIASKNRICDFKTRRDTMISEKIDPLPWFLNVLSMIHQGKTVSEIKVTSQPQKGASHGEKEKR